MALTLIKFENRNGTDCSVKRCKEPGFAEYHVSGDSIASMFCRKHFNELDGGISRIEQASPAPEIVDNPSLPVSIQETAQTKAVEFAEALDMITGFTIEDQEDANFAQEQLKQAKSEYKKLDSERKKATKPMNDSIKVINGWFKPALNTLAAIEKEWKNKLLQAKKGLEEKRERLLLEARESENPHEQLVAASQSHVETQSISYVDNWVFEVEDESKIPAEFMIPDRAAIAKVVKMMKDGTKIPGVRVWNEPIVRSRAS